jgi:glycosyltransferase involved in cell wall biosynthesis
MKIALITDAWEPQVNGVVTTLVELVREVERHGHQIEVIHPGLFKTRPCPGYAGIELAIRPAAGLKTLLANLQPDAIHIATEGPLGWAARSYCLKRGWAFTTAFHTKFPEILKAALKIPLAWGYALFRHFHKASSGVMVPTQGVQRMLEQRGFKNLRSWTHGVDMSLFTYHQDVQFHPGLGVLARPVSLFVGRVSYEKNIEAFLQLDVPGTKIVCGVGPLEVSLRQKYPQVRWLGILSRPELSKVYAAADVFVMPSRSETFGLVMLEAMACGTPVAGYPVDGPLEVLGKGAECYEGGILDPDLNNAWYQALSVPRHEALSRALKFSWEQAGRQFLDNLVPVQKAMEFEKTLNCNEIVTPLSSSM